MNTTGQIQNKSNKLVFSRWSRKSWAVFCSIGCEVKIAVLKLVVADGFIKKNKDGILIPLIVKNEINCLDESPGDFFINPANPFTLILNLIQPQRNIICGGQPVLFSACSALYNKSHPFLFGKDFLFPNNLLVFYTSNHSERSRTMIRRSRKQSVLIYL